MYLLVNYVKQCYKKHWILVLSVEMECLKFVHIAKPYLLYSYFSLWSINFE